MKMLQYDVACNLWLPSCSGRFSAGWSGDSLQALPARQGVGMGIVSKCSGVVLRSKSLACGDAVEVRWSCNLQRFWFEVHKKVSLFRKRWCSASISSVFDKIMRGWGKPLHFGCFEGFERSTCRFNLQNSGLCSQIHVLSLPWFLLHGDRFQSWAFSLLRHCLVSSC